jgi:hypothetical protein
MPFSGSNDHSSPVTLSTLYHQPTLQPAIMKFTQSLLSLALSTTALAVPTGTLQERSTKICGQWDTVATGAYTVYEIQIFHQRSL